MPKTKTMSPTLPVSESTLRKHRKDLEEWPEIWMGDERDIVPGQKMVEFFKPLLIHPLSLGPVAQDIRKHANNLWVLEGEAIRDLHEEPRL